MPLDLYRPSTLLCDMPRVPPVPAEDGPAMKAALADAARKARRARYHALCGRAQQFLSPCHRWELNKLGKNLADMDPDQALVVLERNRRRPSYQLPELQRDFPPAILAFRYLRAAQRAADRRASFLMAAE